MSEIHYDVVIVGAGPAGLGAALYCSRDRFKTLVIDKFTPGGQINTTDRIENYPGTIKISGPDMVAEQIKQCENFGTEFKNFCPANKITKRDDGKLVIETDEDTYIADVVFLTPGSAYRHLDVPGEETFRSAGAGVSYCGTCDAAFFKDKTVVAVGGGNVAVEDTIHLAKFAKKVYMIHRRDEFRAEKILVEELLEEAKKGVIEIVYDSVVTEIKGDGKCEAATVKNLKTNQSKDIACDGTFIFVGMIPNTDFLKGFVKMDDYGFIEVDTTYFRTSVPGVFACGDCRQDAAMQLVTAIGDAVTAAVFMKEYLRDPLWWNKKV